jgi:hypothetical protein
VELVQLAPAVAHVGRVPDLVRRRCTAELDEGSVGSIPQLEQVGVDPATLARR